MIEKNFSILMETQAVFLKKFEDSHLMKLIHSADIDNKEIRIKLMDCIQTFSDYFQKCVMLRYIFTDGNHSVSKMVNEHLSEEFGHNFDLLIDRGNRPAHFDPILDSTAAWFCWKMFMFNHLEKTLLMHWVLESSAYTFFKAAYQVMEKYQETNYFKIHVEADEKHKEIDTYFFKDLRSEEYENLLKILNEGWHVLFTTCNRIAEISIIRDHKS